MNQLRYNLLYELNSKVIAMETIADNKIEDVLMHATRFIKNLETIEGYHPRCYHESIDHLQSLLSKLELIHQKEVMREKRFPEYLEARQTIFFRACKSVTGILKYVGSSIKQASGFGDKLLADVDEMITGMSMVCQSKSVRHVSESFVSKSVHSFATIAESFSDLFHDLKTLQPQVAGHVGNGVDFGDLQLKMTQMNMANSNVMLAYQDYHYYQKLQEELYLELKRRIRETKKVVKLQFGIHSAEFQQLTSVASN